MRDNRRKKPLIYTSGIFFIVLILFSIGIPIVDIMYYSIFTIVGMIVIVETIQKIFRKMREERNNTDER